MDLLKANEVVIIASFPSVNEAQTDSQRGDGIFKKSINIIKKFNIRGYGLQETGLELDLICNPAGAFLPASQGQITKRFHEVLMKKWDIVFNSLFAFANVPLGIFQ